MTRLLVLAFVGFALIGLPAAASADEVQVKKFPTVAEDQSRSVETPKVPLVNRRDLEPANGTPVAKATCITFTEQVLNHYCNTTWGTCYPLRSWCCAYCYDDPFVCVTIGC